MRINLTGHTAEFRYHCWKLPMLLAAMSVTCLAMLGYLLTGAAMLEPGEKLQNQVIGLGIATAIAAFGAALFFENNIFTFDVVERLLVWRKKRLLRGEYGTTPFLDIQSIVIERCSSGKSSGLSTRIVMVTKQGKIPISSAYSGTLDCVNERLANELQQLIGITTDVQENSVREMVRSGRMIDAIEYARKRYSLSLTEAHNLVVESMKTDLQQMNHSW